MMEKELENGIERLRFVTLLKRRVLECCVDDLGQLNPLNLLKTCKNQQAMLAGRATHNQQCDEKFMFLRHKFFSLETNDKNSFKMTNQLC
jgi:hypothetical protein